MQQYVVNGVGAKKGGRVHWLLIGLRPHVYKFGYKVSYNYETKDYAILRKVKLTLRSIFIVSKTSRNAYRLMYHNFLTKKTFYLSFKTALKVADFINRFVNKEQIDEIKAIEEERKISNFILNLKRLMRVFNVSQNELGKHIGVSQQTISRYLTRNSYPDDITIEKIANVFEISFDDLIK